MLSSSTHSLTTALTLTPRTTRYFPISLAPARSSLTPCTRHAIPDHVLSPLLPRAHQALHPLLLFHTDTDPHTQPSTPKTFAGSHSSVHASEAGVRTVAVAPSSNHPIGHIMLILCIWPCHHHPPRTCHYTEASLPNHPATHPHSHSRPPPARLKLLTPLHPPPADPPYTIHSTAHPHTHHSITRP
jgi:hypothetical protein